MAQPVDIGDGDDGDDGDDDNDDDTDGGQDTNNHVTQYFPLPVAQNVKLLATLALSATPPAPPSPAASDDSGKAIICLKKRA